MRLHFLGEAKKLLKLLLVKETTNSQDQLSTIQQAFFKATTVTKEFSKCHSKMPLVVAVVSISQKSMQSHESHQRLLKMPCRLLKMPWVADDAISWNSIYYATDQIQWQKFISWNFYESNPTKGNFQIIFCLPLYQHKYSISCSCRCLFLLRNSGTSSS